MPPARMPMTPARSRPAMIRRCPIRNESDKPPNPSPRLSLPCHSKATLAPGSARAPLPSVTSSGFKLLEERMLPSLASLVSSRHSSPGLVEVVDHGSRDHRSHQPCVGSLFVPSCSGSVAGPSKFRQGRWRYCPEGDWPVACTGRPRTEARYARLLSTNALRLPRR